MTVKNNSIEILKAGGIGVIPSDTLYGLVGQALKRKTVERIHYVRDRHPSKPFIILISSIADLEKFSIKLSDDEKNILNKLWPNKISIVLPCPKRELEYLHRGTKTLAFRIPLSLKLLNILKQTGPLVAPSANPEGERPAELIKEAKKYFGSQSDFYLAAGRRLNKQPSTLIAFKEGKVIVLREGAIKLNSIIKKTTKKDKNGNNKLRSI